MIYFFQRIKDWWRIGEPLFGGVGRSSKWPFVRKDFLILHDKCEVCGKKDKLIVHHCHPFHIFPSDELNPENLITLCEGKTMNCHFVFGHCFLNWKSYNPNIRSDIKIIDNIRKYAKGNLRKEEENI